ncbi:MAG TPA: hypothetical protein VG295_00730 [Solirubrobacteraceae bacterium]|jgi:hypothetical protein|nr:hypothetical protein [Solirubrobacteraceae bacterium]
MTNGRPPLTGKDVAGAGMLMLSVNLLCAGVGAGLGALAGSVAAGLVPGFFIGFALAIFVVSKRFRDS